MGISETEGKKFCKMAPRAILGQISLGRGGHAMYGICLAITQALRQDSGGGRGRRKSRHLPHYEYCGQCPILQREKLRGRVSGALNAWAFICWSWGWIHDELPNMECPFQPWLDIFSAQL